eukprot:TRINITY_DN9772_c0_g2_i2.p1 TRINITY_DN9772_c0_g2~~TRINITY_DN9772_c0_g2_i2.p1  ORF type:complete len:260 (+),score=32.64 TRINITY_DN9772_c0_g2_i2:75-854(+)
MCIRDSVYDDQYKELQRKIHALKKSLHKGSIVHDLEQKEKELQKKIRAVNKELSTKLSILDEQKNALTNLLSKVNSIFGTGLKIDITINDEKLGENAKKEVHSAIRLQRCWRSYIRKHKPTRSTDGINLLQKISLKKPKRLFNFNQLNAKANNDGTNNAQGDAVRSNQKIMNKGYHEQILIAKNKGSADKNSASDNELPNDLSKANEESSFGNFFDKNEAAKENDFTLYLLNEEEKNAMHKAEGNPAEEKDAFADLDDL